MSFFASSIFFVVSIALATTSWVQSGSVSWKTDKCGCIGVWGLGTSSVAMLGALVLDDRLLDTAACMVLAFAVWMVCRAGHKRRWPHGIFGRTEDSPLGDK